MASVIIVAAGSGKRMNSNTAKQYLEIKGRAILSYTIQSFEKCSGIDEIVLVVGQTDVDYVKNEIVYKYGFKKVRAVIGGGKERQNSVYNGLKSLNKDTDIVLVHDGVRPFVTNDDILKIIDNTKMHSACVLGVKVKDTIKVCNVENQVVDTPNRDMLWAAQTPQSFKFELILNAYETAFSEGFLGTDDSMLVERLGHKIKMIEGSYNNIKITTPEDLYIGERILNDN